MFPWLRHGDSTWVRAFAPGLKRLVVVAGGKLHHPGSDGGDWYCGPPKLQRTCRWVPCLLENQPWMGSGICPSFKIKIINENGGCFRWHVADQGLYIFVEIMTRPRLDVVRTRKSWSKLPQPFPRGWNSPRTQLFQFAYHSTLGLGGLEAHELKTESLAVAETPRGLQLAEDVR